MTEIFEYFFDINNFINKLDKKVKLDGAKIKKNPQHFTLCLEIFLTKIILFKYFAATNIFYIFHL